MPDWRRLFCGGRVFIMLVLHHQIFENLTTKNKHRICQFGRIRGQSAPERRFGELSVNWSGWFRSFCEKRQVLECKTLRFARRWSLHGSSSSVIGRSPWTLRGFALPHRLVSDSIDPLRLVYARGFH